MSFPVASQLFFSLFTSCCRRLHLALIFSLSTSIHPPSPYPSSFIFILFFSNDVIWSQLGVYIHAKLSECRASGHSFQLSKIYRMKAEKRPVEQSKDQRFYPDQQKDSYSRQDPWEVVCVKVCVHRLVWRGGPDNVCILRHKGPAGCLQIVWLILIATREPQSQESLVKNYINFC